MIFLSVCIHKLFFHKETFTKERKKAMGIKEEAVGEAINLGSGEEHRVTDLANMVNVLAGNEAGVI